jgi:[ribosomal protein S5]-alanine N-acetyltransferase
MRTTARLELIPIHPGHLLTLIERPDSFAAAFGAPAAPGLRDFFASDDVAPDWLDRLRSASAADFWNFGLVLLETTAHQVIGTAAFKGPPDLHRSVEIAYAVVPSFQGQGYATEAAQALVDLALETGGAVLVRAHTLPQPSASTRVLEKCGFEWVGEVDDPDDGLVWRWERSTHRGQLPS